MVAHSHRSNIQREFFYTDCTFIAIIIVVNAGETWFSDVTEELRWAVYLLLHKIWPVLSVFATNMLIKHIQTILIKLTWPVYSLKNIEIGKYGLYCANCTRFARELNPDTSASKNLIFLFIHGLCWLIMVEISDSTYASRILYGVFTYKKLRFELNHNLLRMTLVLNWLKFNPWVHSRRSMEKLVEDALNLRKIGFISLNCLNIFY